MKTKHYPNDVYRRMENGRYIRIGTQWNGFPMDGIWLVQDGKCNQRLLVGLKEDVPILALRYRSHMDSLSSHLMKLAREKGSRSWEDISRWACDYFAHAAVNK